MELNGEGCVGDLLCEPGDVDFGTVIIGTSSSHKLSLTNPSPCNLHYQLFTEKAHWEDLEGEEGRTTSLRTDTAHGTECHTLGLNTLHVHTYVCTSRMHLAVHHCTQFWGNDGECIVIISLYLTPAGVELNCSEGVLPAGGQCTLIVTVKPWQRARSQVAIRYRVVLQDSKEGGMLVGEGGGGREKEVRDMCM